jgi:hypothetical protein
VRRNGEKIVLASYAEPICSGSTFTITGSVPLVVPALLRIYGRVVQAQQLGSQLQQEQQQFN